MYWDSNITPKGTAHAVAMAPPMLQLSEVAPLLSGLHWLQPTPQISTGMPPSEALDWGTLAHLNHRGSLTHPLKPLCNISEEKIQELEDIEIESNSTKA